MQKRFAAVGLASHMILVLSLLALVTPSVSSAIPRERSQLQGKRRLPQCRDRRDNDRDSLTDFPTDPGCRSKNDKDEFNRRSSRTPTPTPTPENTPTPGQNQPPVDTISLGVNASLGGARPFPADNPWNTDISQALVDPDSSTILSSIGLTTGLHPDFGSLYEGVPNGIPYLVVSGDQTKKSVAFDYDDESDIGPYPIPESPPIEGGDNSTGDRHVILLDRDTWRLYELFNVRKSAGAWLAGSGAIFDLASNDVRPAGFTSADAAGLPIFPGLVRYDEVVERGAISHALRFTVQRSRRAYVHPARHFASSNSSSALPPMGMRVRLKGTFNTAGFPFEVRVILEALKKYGMFVADNGSNWFISGAPDQRWNDDALSTIRQVKGGDFEVIKMSGVVTGN